MEPAAIAAVISAGTAVVGTGVALALAVGRPLRRIARQNNEFRQDWYGTAARPGVPAEPGVMERLQKIEQNTESLPDRMDKVERGQAELRAAVARTDQRLDDHILTHGGTP